MLHSSWSLRAMNVSTVLNLSSLGMRHVTPPGQTPHKIDSLLDRSLSAQTFWNNQPRSDWIISIVTWFLHPLEFHHATAKLASLGLPSHSQNPDTVESSTSTHTVCYWQPAETEHRPETGFWNKFVLAAKRTKAAAKRTKTAKIELPRGWTGFFVNKH